MRLLSAFTLAATLLTVTWAAPDSVAQRLVIMHTNDTHSHIDPDAKTDLGGVLRRKAAIDSIRDAERNSLLIDAGDFVQGSLYFYLYGGEVEQKLMNDLGYDMRILGNHEFDITAEKAAKVMANSKADLLATNYDLSQSAFAGMFKAISIRQIEGKRVGFFAINLDPDGMIAPGKANGVKYLDAIEAANAAAWWLRNVGHCDMVVAITHIGYNTDGADLTDIVLVQKTRGIDLVIGGHSHDVVQPGNPDKPDYATNLDGKRVTIVQTGKYGTNLGKIDIDLATGEISPTLLTIDNRYDNRIDSSLAESLKPYRHGVDSLYAIPVFKSKTEMPQGSDALKNFVSDFVYDRAQEQVGNVDFAIMNDGGMRTSLAKGTVGKGYILDLLPFGNSTVVVDIKGSDLIDVLDVMAQGRVRSVSRQADITYVPAVKTDSITSRGRIVSATIGGKPIDPDRTYRVATIDYLAEGGDYMTPMLHAREVYRSPDDLAEEIIEYYMTGPGRGRTVNPSAASRFRPVH